ncbi:nicotinate-nucleotide adenylyltransferase [Rhodoblastus acidophilus]|uniref:nicotinate-nucleotide adenylyltransferase n=1 Tax=Rhodoblastus acidophilus TaxID=1074 RepID=UPI0022255154|nr:nicotinate-nucleotide adenylyltransferase [Rhodoblastus acidophilus]MCW2283215.1 nicotinate-nucleotide adenylyltransferase [Rhodoblastus acidophilus]MCW2332075.1 nicotinate-nucleotide adenylyltransferase [Rhodoblastus acidophilus]
MIKLPPHAPGMRIGLFGGSFNPPHEGHKLVVLTALRRAGLDALWVLVTPANPLKDPAQLPPAAERFAKAQAFFRNPRVKVTDVETPLRARYSWQTVDFLTRRAPGVKFVWVMGADNLASFHRWRRWRDIARKMPILVVDRPGSTHGAAFGVVPLWYGRRRLPEAQAAHLCDRRPPALVLLHGPRSPLSSTQLRARRHVP